jgi:hypothetical protein
MQTVDRPRFRQDLAAEAIEEGGHKFIDVGDPDAGNMFRLYESEFALACGMDGQRDVSGIVQWAKDELGLSATQAEVRSVISALGQHGFLDQAAAAKAAVTERTVAAPAAAAPARATELAAGVVVGQQQQKPAALDVELGNAGAKAPVAAPLPKAAEIELGNPGAAAATAKPPRPPVEDVALGAPGAAAAKPAARSEVSLDLSEHMGVKPDDVKEAVRQSKVMTAVEVPKDLLEASAKPVVAPPVAAKVEAKPVEAKPVEAKPVEAKPAKQPPVEAKAAKPVTQPVVVAEKKPVQPTAPKQGVSPVLIILLVLAIGGAGAYFAWRYLLKGKSDTTAQVQPPPVTPASGSVAAPETPPAPPPPKGKIQIVSGEPRDILSVFAGSIETIDATERDIDTSDILAKLTGAKRVETDLAALDKEIERRMTVVKNAESAREKLNPAPAEGSGGSAAAPAKPPTEAQTKAADAAVDKAQKALEDKQNERGTKEEVLEKLYVRAPFEGHITITAKQGQKIEENTPIAKITPKAAPTVKFTLDKNMTLDRGIAVPIRANEKMYTCEVSDSNVDGTTVVCRTNTEGLTDGAEAILLVEQQ